MEIIKLRRSQWFYDPDAQLGATGGFGSVFHGTGPDGIPVAVKRLKLSRDEVGNRELSIAEELAGKVFSHVIPVFDSGVDAETGRYFVVMALAEKSLQDELAPGALNETDILQILTQIASGLAELETLVHRDLKPANILYHNGAWKIADFGIARFVEKATSANTMKEFLTRQYAAPEQWRYERSTPATDIYAFGCIAYALLTGEPPFVSGDLRTRHINEKPPVPPASSRMKQLVSQCLRKNPKARPSISSVLKQLTSIATQPTRSSAIAAAATAVAQEQAQKDADVEQQRTLDKERSELARDAVEILDLLLDEMFESILSDAPIARRLPGDHGVMLGEGKLVTKVPFPRLDADVFPNWGRDIVCGAVIWVEQPYPKYPKRSANLWYGNLDEAREYRWWEIAYWSLGRNEESHEPFGITNRNRFQDVDFAGSSVSHTINFAAPPTPIDGEHFRRFVQRWSDRLAEASRGQMRKPRSLPEQ